MFRTLCPLERRCNEALGAFNGLDAPDPGLSGFADLPASVAQAAVLQRVQRRIDGAGPRP